MSKKTIIFGTTHFAKMLYYYISEDGQGVSAFTVDGRYITKDLDFPCEVIPFEQLSEVYPPYECEVLPVVGYFDMNDRRKQIFQKIRQAGFKIGSYIHPTACIAKNSKYGDGLIALEQAVIQPFVNLGDGNVLWSNANISHNSEIGNFNWFAPNASLAGDVVVGNNCFFGNNCSVKNGITVGDYTLVGAGSYVRKSTSAHQVIKASKSDYCSGTEYKEF